MGKKSQLISIFLIGATLTTLSTNVFAVESKSTIERKMLAGQHRYETAANVSRHGWSSAKNVVLVNSESIPDALAATPFAKLKEAPILLTTNSNLTETTKNELKRLQATNIFIIGGEGVVSKAVVKELTDMGMKVERISGEGRVETAIEVARYINSKEVAIVNGYTGLSDALSIAPVAADKGMPIMITSKDNLGKNREYIEEKGIEKSYIIGGTGVISEYVEKSLPNIERISGIDRNETNARVLEKFYTEKEYNNIYIAKDGKQKEDQLIDALSVSVLAGKEKSPLILAGAAINTNQKTYLQNKSIKTVYEVGYGINKNTVEDIVKALSVKDVVPDPKPDPEPEKNVMSVKAINSSQLKIEFGKVVDENSATDLDNYEITNNDNSKEVLIDDKTSSIKLSEDKKSAVLTLKQGYSIKRNQTTLKVEIKNIYLDGSKDKIDNFKEDVRILSTSIPKLINIKQVGKKEFDLKFSEPVTADTNNDLRNAIRFANNQYPSEVKTIFDNNGLDENTVRVVLSSELKDGDYEVEIKDGIYNYAGFKVEEGHKKFNSTKDESEIKAVVDKVKENEVTLKFNKPIDEEKLLEKSSKDNIEFYLDYKNSDYKMNFKSVENDKIILKSNDLPLGKHKILIRYKDDDDDKIQDLWGNKFEETDIEYNLKGENAPTVKAEYNKYDKTIDLKFNKPVTGAADVESYILTNENGDEIELDDLITQKGNDGREYSIKVSDKDFIGDCELEIVEGKIRDTTVQRKPVEPITLKINVPDTFDAKVKMVTYGGEHGDQIFIRFDRKMKIEGASSVIDKKNYLIDYNGKGYKALNEIEDTEIDVGGDNDLVSITLPDEIDIDEPVNIHIGSVSNADGKLTSMNGIECKNISDDRNIKIANIEKVEDLDKQSGKVAVVNSSTVELYLDREINYINNGKIKLKVGNEEFKPIAMDKDEALKEVDGEDGNLYYKVTLDFDEEIFNTDGKIKYNNASEGIIEFEDEAFETVNYSTSKNNSITIKNESKDSENKTVDKYAPEMESATLINGGKIIEVKFTEEVKLSHISADTFTCEDYDIENVVVKGKLGDTVLVTLDSEPKDKFKLKLNTHIFDRYDNEMTKKQSINVKTRDLDGNDNYGPICKNVTIDEKKENITVTFDKTIEDAKLDGKTIKEHVKIGDNLLGENDSITVEENTIIIKLENALTENKTISISKGSIRGVEEGYVLKEDVNKEIIVK